MQKGKLVSTKIDIEKLRSHPMESARLSKCMARKLLGNIQAVGHYEPVVVRQHDSQKGFYEVLSGQTSVEALRKIGHTSVNCDVWEIDPISARLFLAIRDSVNGVLVPELRMDLLFSLLDKFDPDELGALLPEGAPYLQKLLNFRDNIAGGMEAGFDEMGTDLSTHAFDTAAPVAEPLIDDKVTMTVRLTRSQHAKVKSALHAFMTENGISDIADAFVRIMSRSA